MILNFFSSFNDYVYVKMIRIRLFLEKVNKKLPLKNKDIIFKYKYYILSNLRDLA